MPVISLQYFDKEACRAELRAFHAAASNLGVTELGLYELGKRMEDGGAVLAKLADEVATNMMEFTRHVNAARLGGAGFEDRFGGLRETMDIISHFHRQDAAVGGTQYAAAWTHLGEPGLS